MSLLAMIPSEDEQIESIESIDHSVTMNAEPTERSAFIVSQEELDNVLRRGTGFEDGKLRVAALYANHPDAQTAQRFLKEEYGSSGHSHTYLDGSHGFVDYNARGMRLTRHGFAEDVRLRWPVVEQHIRRMVESGIYLDGAERQRFEEIQLAMTGHDLPMPIPRYAYEPHVPVKEASSPKPILNETVDDSSPLRLALSWEDIDIDRGAIHIRHACKRVGEKNVIGSTKSQAGVRDVPLDGRLWTALQPACDSGLVLPADDGGTLTRQQQKRMWERIQKKCGIEFNAYVNRHNYGTMLAEQDVPAKATTAVMGHAKLETTTKYYQHMTDRMFNNTAHQMSAGFDRVLNG